MSLESWKEEFYPEEAVEAAKRGDSAAVEHSLRKWMGLSPANLEKHGMVASKAWSHIVEQENYERVFRTHAGTCALCELHAPYGCEDCPLTKARGVTCGDKLEDEVRSPWSEWTHNRNPEPMIHWLTLAKEQVNDR